MSLIDIIMGSHEDPEKEEAPMGASDESVERVVDDIPCEANRCHHKKPNLCNDLALLFGASGGRKDGDMLEVVGGSGVGYAVDEALLREAKVAWAGDCDVEETFGIIANGEIIDEFTISNDDDGVKCIKINKYLCDCDVLQVVSLAADGARACDLSVSLWIEPRCYKHFIKEGDGVAEFYISPTGSVPIPPAFTPIDLDVVRVNTIPAFVSYAGGVATLKEGVYKIDYAVSIATQTSTALDFSAHILVDGAYYPSSIASQHILAGSGGDVSLAQGVTLVVHHGQTKTIQLEAKTSIDSSTSATADANLVIQRIANSIDL